MLLPKRKMTSLQNTGSLSFFKIRNENKTKRNRAPVLIFLISLQTANRPKELWAWHRIRLMPIPYVHCKINTRTLGRIWHMYKYPSALILFKQYSPWLLTNTLNRVCRIFFFIFTRIYSGLYMGCKQLENGCLRKLPSAWACDQHTNVPSPFLS